MKKGLYIIVLFGIVVSIMLSGCDNNDKPEPVIQTKRIHSLADSTACCAIFKKNAYYMSERFAKDTGFDLSDVSTWPVEWEWDETRNEFKVVTLILVAPALPYNPSSVPEAIINLDKLKNIQIRGGSYFGYLPRMISLKNLEEIWINNTSIDRLPDDIFNENLNVVQIMGNKSLIQLPTSVLNLKSEAPDGTMRHPTAFNLSNNGFSGVAPAIVDAKIYMEDNNYTTIDWDGAGGRTVFRDGERNWYGAILRWNYIHGKIPDEILSDTLRLVNLYSQTDDQYYGLGFSNMPSEEEISKMRKEYNQNHPGWLW